MKKYLLLTALGGMLALTTSALAADTTTVTGEAKCAKCALHDGDKCQTVIQAESNGKTTTYYVADNKVGKEFHDNICKEAHKVTATGTVAEKDGKKILTASKIEMAK